MDPIGMSTPRKSNATSRICRKKLKKMFRKNSLTSDSSYGTPASAHPKYFPEVLNNDTLEVATKYREPIQYTTESNTSDSNSPCWTDQEVELYQERHNPKDRRVSGILQKGGALINNRTKVPSQIQLYSHSRNRKLNRINHFNEARMAIKNDQNENQNDVTLKQSPAGKDDLQDISIDTIELETESFELKNDLTFLFHDQDEEEFDRILRQKVSKAPFEITMASQSLAKSLLGSSKIFYGSTPFHSRKLPKVKRTFCRKSSIRLSRRIRLSRKFRKSRIPKCDQVTLDLLIFLWNQSNIQLRAFVILIAIIFLKIIVF